MPESSDHPSSYSPSDAAPQAHSRHQVHAKQGDGWKKYLFEFFMLFLAVVCGFLAENWREQRAEDQQEKEYMQSMVEDLKTDTLQSGIVLMSLRRTHRILDSLIAALASPAVINNSNTAYRLWNKSHGFMDFITNDGTLQQLKSGGGLRLINNRQVVDSIMKYDRLVQDFNHQSEFMTGILEDQRIYGQLFESIRHDSHRDKPKPLSEQGQRVLNEAYANRKLWGFAMSILIKDLERVQAQAGSLIVFIQEQYQFD